MSENKLDCGCVGECKEKGKHWGWCVLPDGHSGDCKGSPGVGLPAEDVVPVPTPSEPPKDKAEPKRWMKLPKNSMHPNFTELHREDDWCAKVGCTPYCGPDPSIPEPTCVPAEPVAGETKENYHESLMVSLQDSGEAMAYLQAAHEDSPVAFRKAMRNVIEATNRTSDAVAVPGEGKIPRQLLLAKFPSLDPVWPTEIQDKWFQLFSALKAYGESVEPTPLPVPLLPRILDMTLAHADCCFKSKDTCAAFSLEIERQFASTTLPVDLAKSVTVQDVVWTVRHHLGADVLTFRDDARVRIINCLAALQKMQGDNWQMPTWSPIPIELEEHFDSLESAPVDLEEKLRELANQACSDLNLARGDDDYLAGKFREAAALGRAEELAQSAELLRLLVEWEEDYRTRNHLGTEPPQPFRMAAEAIRAPKEKG